MKYRLDDEEFKGWVVIAILVIVSLPIGLSMTIGRLALDVFSVITTSLLSLGLVLLYFQQSRMLDKQTELVRRDYMSRLQRRETLIADEDNINIQLKNKGRGKVHRMFLKSEIVSDTGNLDIGFGRVNMESVESGSLEIPPHSDYNEFTGEVRFRMRSSDKFDDDRGFPFQYISSKLSQEGFSSCTLKLTLEIIDEGTIDEKDEVEIAKQEMYFNEPEIRETAEGEIERHRATKLEEAIESDYSSEQDINRDRFDELL